VKHGKWCTRHVVDALYVYQLNALI